jgi:Flp pilus assembly pilin Flp
MRRHLSLICAHAATLGRGLSAWLAAHKGQVEGQGLTEYGLILVLIMVVCVGILTLTGTTISEVWYGSIVSRLP